MNRNEFNSYEGIIDAIHNNIFCSNSPTMRNLKRLPSLLKNTSLFLVLNIAVVTFVGDLNELKIFYILKQVQHIY